MNDHQIREAFHRKSLRDHHNEFTTLVIDELGIDHGNCRADIAVINGHMIGYEIKSSVDTLNRLSSQIKKYDAVFDHSYIIVTDRHIMEAKPVIPKWWGMILAFREQDEILFRTLRSAKKNHLIDDYSVVQLLWRNEAQEILMDLGITGKKLRENRSNLYRYILDMFKPNDLRFIVREYLKKRQDWRQPRIPLPNDD